MKAAYHIYFVISIKFCQTFSQKLSNGIGNNKWSQNFDERLHCHLVALVTANGFIHPRPPSNTWFLGPTWVSPQWNFDQLSRFCIHRSKVSQCFSMDWTTHKLPLPLGGSRPHLIMLSCDHVGQPPNGISIGSAVLCGAHPCDQRTDKPCYVWRLLQ